MRCLLTLPCEKRSSTRGRYYGLEHSLSYRSSCKRWQRVYLRKSGAEIMSCGLLFWGQCSGHHWPPCSTTTGQTLSLLCLHVSTAKELLPCCGLPVAARREWCCHTPRTAKHPCSLPQQSSLVKFPEGGMGVYCALLDRWGRGWLQIVFHKNV